MAEGMFRAVRPDLGDCVRMNWGASPDCFLTKDTYEAGNNDPPYDELPSEEEYKADRRGPRASDDA
jgi:hypothetical protein